MRRKPGSQPTRELVHPNEADIAVTVQRPKRSDTIENFAILAKHQRAINVLDKDGNVALLADGSPQVHVQQLYPLEATLSYLRMTVINWRGISDADGKPIPFTPEAIGELLEEWLDVDENGQKRAFSMWIADQLRKPECFDADPLVSGSSKP